MEYKISSKIALTLAATLCALGVHAQEPGLEEWTGTLKREGKQTENVTFQVRVSEEKPFIVEMIYADTPFEFKQQQFKGESLIFIWTPGEQDVDCRLEKDDEGDYRGDCQIQDSDKKFEMQIKPRPVSVGSDAAEEYSGAAN